MEVIQLTSVRFKRARLASWESGIMINHDQLIIDTSGKAVPGPIYNLNLCPDHFNMHLHFPREPKS